MESIEYSRALIPFCLLIAFEVISRYRKRIRKDYAGMKSVQLSLMGALICWFSIFISLLLFTQLLIDPPGSLYMVLFVLFIISAVAMISLQHLSVMVFFSNESLTMTSLFGKPRHCDYSAVLAVKEKRYAGEGNGRIMILVLPTGQIKLPVFMLGGEHQFELESLLKNLMKSSTDKLY